MSACLYTVSHNLCTMKENSVHSNDKSSLLVNFPLLNNKILHWEGV